jgi:multicomponent Na+:H+ antiporter subunit E
MINPVVLHLFIALVWFFLSGNQTVANFLVAFLCTFALMALFRKAIDCEGYIRRTVAFYRFIVHFILDIIASNLRIMRVAISREAGRRHGRFIEYDVAGLTDLEVLLISQCIGLSPGTMVAERVGGERLVIHTFATGEPHEVRASLDRTLKSGILGFTR